MLCQQKAVRDYNLEIDYFNMIDWLDMVCYHTFIPLLILVFYLAYCMKSNSDEMFINIVLNTALIITCLFVSNVMLTKWFQINAKIDIVENKVRNKLNFIIN